MPFDSNGNYTLPTSYFVENGDTVLPIQHNPPFEDVAQALSSVLPRSGVAPMNGPLKMGGNKVTGMADGTATTDGVTKQQLDAAASEAATNNVKFASKSAAYTAVKADKATALRFTAAATLSLTAAATLGANWWCEVQAANGSVTVDPNAAETIDGATTAIIQTGQIARISCDGTAFATEIVGNPLSGPQLQGFYFGLGLSTNATDAANDVDIAAGAAASDTSPFYLMQLGTAITKRLDANWAVGTNQGGLDTGSVSAAATYYIWLIQRSDTLVVDALFSLSSTAPTMPANYDRKRRIGVVSRVASVNSTPDSILIDAIGIGQTWQIPTRAAGSVYQNTTGRSIQVHVSASRAGPANAFFKVSADNITWVNVAVARTSSSDGNVSVLHASIIIPPGFYYQVTGAALDFGTWSELRA